MFHSIRDIVKYYAVLNPFLFFLLFKTTLLTIGAKKKRVAIRIHEFPIIIISSQLLIKIHCFSIHELIMTKFISHFSRDSE